MIKGIGIMSDLLGLGKLSTNSLEVIKTIYPDLAQPALKKVGLALESTIDFTTIPFKYLSLFSQKADMNIKKHLQDFQETLDNHNEEQIGCVSPEIGVPILDELTRVTSEELASMYKNLLLNASLVKKSQYAHPSFVNILKNLSSDEAKIIRIINDIEATIAFIKFRRIDTNGSSVTLNKQFNNLSDLVDLDYEENDKFYAENLITLGILEEKEVFFISNLPVYEELENKHRHVVTDFMNELNKLPDNHELSDSRVVTSKGTYIVTEFGKQFIESVCANNDKLLG